MIDQMVVPAAPATTLSEMGDFEREVHHDRGARVLHAEEAWVPAAEPDGEVRDVSVLMADLRGFTTFCEQSSPYRTAAILNDYLTAMMDVILAHHGRVQDFAGDGILGVFGAPLFDGDHAWHATLAALRMQSVIRCVRSRWGPASGADLALGIALHSGEVFAGTFGSPRQSKYAVVGDPVNTVARLEELNRGLGTAIVMSSAMHARLGERVNARARGSFAVRGRSHPVEVLELLGARRTRRPPVSY